MKQQKDPVIVYCVYTFTRSGSLQEQRSVGRAEFLFVVVVVAVLSFGIVFLLDHESVSDPCKDFVLLNHTFGWWLHLGIDILIRRQLQLWYFLLFISALILISCPVVSQSVKVISRIDDIQRREATILWRSSACSVRYTRLVHRSSICHHQVGMW